MIKIFIPGLQPASELLDNQGSVNFCQLELCKTTSL